MKTKLIAVLVTVVAALSLLTAPVITQQANVLFGTSSNAVVPLSVTSTGVVNATVSSGTVAAANGGTGQSSYAVGDLLYANTTTTLAKLADVAIGQVLVSGGANTAPAYSATPSLTSLTLTAGGGTQTGKVGQTLFSSVATTGSSTGGAIDQASYTLPASTLSADGQKLVISQCALHAANTNTATGGFVVFGTSLSTSADATSGGLLCGSIEAVRTSSTTVAVQGYTMGSASFTQNRNSITGLTLSNTQVLKFTFSTATANNDLTGKYFKVVWFPE